ncbi:hypothetical protein P170DRAFT_513347 [Aspergillus steynii IBT 23096]|uniref:Antifungal protein n=1 Tax=Aspergillus steynii IBT 23096 TaxID=1392250 RepID=A0A2I2FXG1_9EURO|nr:uncharacterized protein P170DRAFT_513347 [Aspergillus steynii IBT 23096]PLB45324.1 hypothetical protein P170DRAFT_513347 [Aspergillus steynii IBT 23096]
MQISFLTTLTLIGAALAVPGADAKQKTIAIGAPCTKDGNMGVCDKGGFCLQKENAKQGVCKPAN